MDRKITKTLIERDPLDGGKFSIIYYFELTKKGHVKFKKKLDSLDKKTAPRLRTMYPFGQLHPAVIVWQLNFSLAVSDGFPIVS